MKCLKMVANKYGWSRVTRGITPKDKWKDSHLAIWSFKAINSRHISFVQIRKWSPEMASPWSPNAIWWVILSCGSSSFGDMPGWVKWVRHLLSAYLAGVRGNLRPKCVSLTPNAWDLTGLEFRTPSINAKCRSMPIKILELIRNT